MLEVCPDLRRYLRNLWLKNLSEVTEYLNVTSGWESSWIAGAQRLGVFWSCIIITVWLCHGHIFLSWHPVLGRMCCARWVLDLPQCQLFLCTAVGDRTWMPKGKRGIDLEICALCCLTFCKPVSRKGLQGAAHSPWYGMVKKWICYLGEEWEGLLWQGDWGCLQQDSSYGLSESPSFWVWFFVLRFWGGRGWGILLWFFFVKIEPLEGKVMVEAASWESSADTTALYCHTHGAWVKQSRCVHYFIIADILIMLVRISSTKVCFPLFIFPIWREWGNEVNSSVWLSLSLIQQDTNGPTAIYASS